SGWTAGWHRVGGILTSSPAASGLRAAIRGRDGQVWTATRAQGLYGGWSGWTRGPALPGGLLAAAEPGMNAIVGSAMFYVRGSDGAAWWIWRQASGEWARWTSLGGLFTSGLVAINHYDGVTGINITFVYGRGLNGRLYQKPGNSAWHVLGG